MSLITRRFLSALPLALYPPSPILPCPSMSDAQEINWSRVASTLMGYISPALFASSIPVGAVFG